MFFRDLLRKLFTSLATRSRKAIAIEPLRVVELELTLFDPDQLPESAGQLAPKK